MGQWETCAHITENLIAPTGTTFNIESTSWRTKDVWLTTTRLLLATHAHGSLYTFKNCSQSPRKGTVFNYQCQLELFPPAGPLEFFAVHILGSLPRTKTRNQYVVIITDRYSKLTRALPTAKPTSTQVTHIPSMTLWFSSVSQISSYLKTVNNPYVNSSRQAVPTW